MAKSLKKNFLLNVLLTMSSVLFPLITFPYISRVLLPVGTGKITLAISIIAYFEIFAQLGIPTYGIRACAQVRDNREELTRTAHELLFINLATSLISYIALAAALIFVPRLHEEKLLYVIISATMFLSAVGMEWLYKALEQYKYITIRSIIFKVIALIAMFLLVHKQDDYLIYGGISILATSASNILNFINAHKYIDMHPVGGYRIQRHFKAVFIFFAMACATTIYTNLNTVMLGLMKTDADTGFFGAAVKIKNVLVSLVTSLGVVMLPRASFYIEHGMKEEFWRINKKALNFVFVVALPLMMYFILFARPSVLLLSGTAFENSIIPMQVIMPTLIFIGVTNILGIQILVPLGRERTVLYSEIAGAVIDLIVNMILIPRMGVVGAAIGMLAAEAAVLLVQFAALKNEVADAFKSICYHKILIGIFVGSLASCWVYAMRLGNFTTLLFSASLFFGAYGICLLLIKEPMIKELTEHTIGVIQGRRRK